jgi:threonine synthase
MKFVSLTNPTDIVSFEEALFRGISKDGSLYFPIDIPILAEDEIQQLLGASPQPTARLILGKWLEDEIPSADLDKIIENASTFETPLVSVGDKKILELFHGPTLAFKDVAASYLAALVSYFNQINGRHRSTVLVATSGDTGGAIARGFGGVERVNVVVLYPKGRVSRLQLEQIHRVAANVQAIEVVGSFDDCQLLVKRALADEDLSAALNLMSANSINIGRLLPQSTYYAYTYSQLGAQTGRFVVPSGNLGNITGGSLARAMGVPIPGFLAANNANDAFVRYIQNNDLQPTASIQTFSNAMDVAAPNNLPRLMQFFNRKGNVPKDLFQASRVSDEDTIRTIKQVYRDTGYLLDPHTAVAWHASEITASPSPFSDIIVATASPLKFAEEILEKTGIEVDNTAELEALRSQPERYATINNSITELTQFLRDVNQ